MKQVYCQEKPKYKLRKTYLGLVSACVGVFLFLPQSVLANEQDFLESVASSIVTPEENEVEVAPIADLNHVSNSSFEPQDYVSSKPNLVLPSGEQVEVVSEEGNHHLRLTDATAEAQVNYQIATTPDTDYRVTVDVRKEEEPLSDAAIRVYALDEMEQLGELLYEHSLQDTTTQWQSQEFVFTANTPRTNIRFEKQGGVLELDNIAVRDTTVYQLIWQDEFNGERLDEKNWGYELGSIRGNEQQHYSHSKDNVLLENGDLVLKVTKRAEEDYYQNPRGHRQVIYNSGSVRTHGRQEFLYGRIEARMKLPKGKGVFPAFWTLGAEFHLDGRINPEQAYGWPQSGEIDIMEIIGWPTKEREATGEVGKQGNSNRVSYGTPHYYYQNTTNPDGDGTYAARNSAHLRLTDDFYDSYHIFGINWSPEKLEWYVDDVLYNTMYFTDGTNTERNHNLQAAQLGLNRPQYLQFNLATGGNWAGDAGDYLAEDDTELRIDWVRWLQSERQKKASEAYYQNQPTITGVRPQAMIVGTQPDLLAGVGTQLESHIVDYSVEDEYMFVSHRRDAADNEIEVRVSSSAERVALSQLQPGVYNIHYSAFDPTTNRVGKVPPVGRIARQSTELVVLPERLSARIGQRLGDIALPEGFSWVSPDEIVSEEMNLLLYFSNPHDDGLSPEKRRVYQLTLDRSILDLFTFGTGLYQDGKGLVHLSSPTVHSRHGEGLLQNDIRLVTPPGQQETKKVLNAQAHDTRKEYKEQSVSLLPVSEAYSEEGQVGSLKARRTELVGSKKEETKELNTREIDNKNLPQTGSVVNSSTVVGLFLSFVSGFIYRRRRKK